MQLCELASTRTRLYKLSVVFIGVSLLLFIIFIFVLPTDAVEPRLRWLADIINIILPGQHDRLADFIAKYPEQTLLVIIVIWLIRRTVQWVKAGSQEFAFQAWQRTDIVEKNNLPEDTPPIGKDVKFIKRIAPPQWLTCTVVLGFFLGLALELLWCPCVQANPGNSETQSINCNEVRGLCQLGTGEALRLTINANQARNETGLILKTNEIYTIRYITKNEWRDKNIEVEKAEGFEFSKGLLGLPRFWWIKWRRPYPEGRWFQVLGRIDRNHEVFPVLDSIDASQPFPFTPPKNGELVLFVNDVIYSNNHGVMVIEISRLDLKMHQR